MPDCTFLSSRFSRLRFALFAIVICAATFDCGTVVAEEGTVDYEKEIKPLLKTRCFACHGALKQEGGLRLDTAELIKLGGDSGGAISLEADPAESLLVERVATDDVAYRMPPEHEGEPFDAHEVDLLKRWIATGAIAPKNEQPEPDVEDHWSFQPVQRLPLPPVQDADWVRNPIDTWVLAGYEANGLVPQQEASRIVLVRRLYLDLIGLPPTLEEIEAAEADTSDDWYEKIVDKLLDDPRYGERWGRHWMDVWRYSDWWGLGDQLRNSQRHMWRWRDWIVESLNDDLPYDEMVRLMLAADELAPNDPSKLRATGFLARNYYIFNRNQWMDDVVTHVGKGFLGLTLNCAKCHDHKFDPIPQVDYYRMRAIFEPYHVRLDMVPGTTDVIQDGLPRVFDGALDKPTYLFIRGDEAHPDKSHPVAPGVPEIFGTEELDVQPVSLPEEAWRPSLRSWVLENYLAEAQTRLEAAQGKRDEAAAQLEAVESASRDKVLNFTPIDEPFDVFDENRWRIDAGDWRHTSGALEQKQDGPVRAEVTLLDQVPRDFDAELRFQIIGGSKYRSVGIDFDVVRPQSTDAGNEPGTFPFVYVSGCSEEMKVQGAYSVKGNSAYPADGRRPHSLDLDRSYVLKLQVRGDLVNVSIDGEFVLAWRIPLSRKPGAMRLITYDALATIDNFRVTALDPAVPLVESDQVSGHKARAAYELAEAELAVSLTELEMLKRRIVAVAAQRENKDSALRAESRLAAIRSEREHAVALARQSLLVAQQALAKAPEDKKGEGEKKRVAAAQALEEKLALLDAEILPGADFSIELPGAKWSATRFGNTGRDDPAIAFPSISTGRRTALAAWITDPGNPLTARVAVNQMWMRHFGAPLAATPFDFGRNSPSPTHPELLDWLAAELMDHQWSMKRLHRLIVTSAAYRISSSPSDANENSKKDPDNDWLWRRQPLRLESQVVRDSILYLAGTLDPQQGGPPVTPEQQESSRRRSLYFFHSNNERNLFLSTFDEAEVTECYRREQSVVPQQALAMTNSKLVLESASQIAHRINATTASEEEFIRAAFASLLGIHPQPAEIKATREALEKWKNLPGGSIEQARSQVVWVLLNHNDFVTVR